MKLRFLVILFITLSCLYGTIAKTETTSVKVKYMQTDSQKDEFVNELEIAIEEQNTKIEVLTAKLDEFEKEKAFWSVKFGSLTQTYATIFTLFMGFIFAFNFFTIQNKLEKKIEIEIKNETEKLLDQVVITKLELYKMKENITRLTFENIVEENRYSIPEATSYYSSWVITICKLVDINKEYEVKSITNSVDEFIEYINRAKVQQVKQVRSTFKCLDTAYNFVFKTDDKRVKVVKTDIEKIINALEKL